MTYILLSVGSNIQRETNIKFAIKQIIKLFGDINISPVYETGSVGFTGPAFFNLVVGFHSDEELLNVREKLRSIESSAGRVRGKKSFDNRILDIDIILFGEHDFRSEGFNIPRDEIEKYAYVLKPLSDLHPDMIHPVLGQSYIQLWQKFDKQEQVLEVYDFQF